MTATLNEPALQAAPIVPILIGGKWAEPSTQSFGPVYNPSTGQTIGRVPMCGPKEVDDAVDAALRAFAGWSNMPVMKRAAILFKYREIMNAHFEELVALVTKENGKTIEESKGDVRRGLEVIEFCCGVAQLSKGESLPQIADELGHIRAEGLFKGERVITNIERVSRPGCRVYVNKTKLPRVLGGLGISIVTTSHGVMTGQEARKQGFGGELLCNIY